jgi:hypothetical protein
VSILGASAPRPASMPTPATHHAVHVERWLDGAASDLSTEGLIALLERALVALWQSANTTLGEVTLTAIVDRVLYTAAEQYPFLSIAKVQGAVRFEIRLLGDVQRDRRLLDVIRFVLMEFLSVLGHLTDEILTPAMHATLSTVRRDERESTGVGDDAEETGQ